MISFLGQLISNTTTATNASKAKLNADDQARFALDRIGEDLQRLAKRPDLDYKVLKNPGANDEIYFYSEVPGLGVASVSDAQKQSGLSLIGYRINSETNKLERYSESIQWDNLSFLSYGTNNQVIGSTTLKSKLGNLDNKKFHVLCDGIFRMEVQFILRDGTYSYDTFLLNGSGLVNVSSGEVNSRQPPGNAESPEICIAKDSSGASVWRGLGWRDVSAVIVTIVVIDDSGRKILSDSGVNSLASKFRETSSADLLPMESWEHAIESGFSGMPKKAVSGLRVYQRTFYLSTL